MPKFEFYDRNKTKDFKISMFDVHDGQIWDLWLEWRSIWKLKQKMLLNLTIFFYIWTYLKVLQVLPSNLKILR